MPRLVSAIREHDGADAFRPGRPVVWVSASASSLTPDIDSYDIFRFTALAANLTINAPSGTPHDEQKIRFELQDDGTTRTIAFVSAAFRPGTVVPKTATYGNGLRYTFWEYVYDDSRSLWCCSDTADEVDYPATETSYVGGRTYESGSSSGSVSLNGTLSGGSDDTPSTGDIVIVIFGAIASGFDEDLTVTSGWTEVCDLFANDSYDTDFAVFYKIMGETPDTSFDYDASNSVAIAVHVRRSIDATTPLDGVSPVTGTGINGGQPDLGSITPGTDGSEIIVAGATSCYNTGAVFTNSELDNFISVYKNPGVVVGVGSKAGAASTPFDPAQFSGGSTHSNASWCGCAFVIRAGGIQN